VPPSPDRPAVLWMERYGQSLQGQDEAWRGGGRRQPRPPEPSLTEFIGGLNFDGVFIDCEHGVASVERVQEMCRAARAARIQSIVRPETDAPHLIARYLDAGAGGVIVPHVETAAAAQRIVQTVRYTRPQDCEDKVVVIMIESLAAIENLPDMLKVEGVDVYFIGPNDLAHSMGFPAQPHRPEVKATVKQATAKIRAAGKIAGTLVVNDTATEFLAAGCGFLYEHANNFFAAGAAEFRRRLG
jgi:2-keto-3-deoxy-L-rhamnonate aldolase RhmA